MQITATFLLSSILDLKKVLQQAEITISEKNQEIETCIKQGKNLEKEIKTLEKNLKDSKHKVQCLLWQYFVFIVWKSSFFDGG